MPRDYLSEEHNYRRLHARGERYALHEADASPEPDFEQLFGWDGFPGAGERLLEIGCGDGFVTRRLLERGCLVTGVDSSPTAIEGCRRNLADHGYQAELLVADVCRGEGLGGRRFPAILDSHCLHCIVDDEHRAAFLRSCRRWLAPGGRLFIATMAEQPMGWIEEGGPADRRFVQDEQGCWRVTVHYPGTERRVETRILVSEDKLRGEIAAAGFAVERFERFAPPEDPEDYSFLVVCV